MRRQAMKQAAVSQPALHRRQTSPSRLSTLKLPSIDVKTRAPEVHARSESLEERRTSWLSGSITNTASGRHIGAHKPRISRQGNRRNDSESCQRCRQCHRMSQTQAAFMRAAGCRQTAILIWIGRAGQTHRRPKGEQRPAGAHRRSVGQRLERIESNRKQRHHEGSRSPSPVEAHAIHATFLHDSR